MSLSSAVRRRLRTVFVCAVLQVGLLMGVPVRPDELETLMQQMSKPRVAHELLDEDDSGGEPPPG